MTATTPLYGESNKTKEEPYLAYKNSCKVVGKWFSNLLGTVYKKGNVSFTPDGNVVISPVGNKLSLFDLKNNKSETLPCESQFNITAVGISPDGNLAIAANEEGEAMIISLRSRSVLHTYHFHRPVHAISFSPNGKKIAVTKENTTLMFHAPGKTTEFNPFTLERTFYGAYDETVSIDWTSDSSAFCVGGKDMTTRVYGAAKYSNLIIYSLGGHTDSIINAFFEDESLDVYTISRNGQLCVWECDTDLDGLLPVQQQNSDEGDSEDSDDEEKEKKRQSDGNINDTAEKKQGKILYKRLGKYNYKEARGDGAPRSRVTAAAYHKKIHILVTGFEDGAFFLHEMPDFNLIHSLSISDQSISSINFNKTGDWIAMGCAGVGQLLVWEWQSESYILKQQGHFNNMNCLAYSPDGMHIVSGGDDGKVKVWNTSNGFCFVTFVEHIGAITGVTFTQSGQVVLSSSLDGTVRAFDLNRYRNFRTFTSPRPVQFACLAVDNSGEIICAGGKDVFEIFVWSMKTGRLLEVLAGHEGPISSLAFPTTHMILASGSWDKTVKLWDIFESRGAKETLTLNSDVLALAYRPDGEEIAVATINAQISFWNVHTATQVGSIEGRHDIGYTRKEGDKITAKKSAFGKAFNTICYSADGKFVLAGGRSKNVCIYCVREQMRRKVFEITCNFSLDGTVEFLDKRKMTKWGNLALVEEGQGDDGDGKSISLPGVRKGDMSSRHWKPEVRVSSVHFSPTGREWAATTTEGLLIYSLDNNLVFDPFDLEIDITPENVLRTLDEKEYQLSLMLALKLNEEKLIQQVMETVPISEVEAVVEENLPDFYVDCLLSFMGRQIEKTQHLEFYVRWTEKLLYIHGPKLKKRSSNILPQLRNIHKAMTEKMEHLRKICDHNRYTTDYLLALSQTKAKRPHSAMEDGQESDDQLVREAEDSDSDELDLEELMS